MLAICLWLKSALVVLILALARWLVSVWGEVRAIFSARDQIYVIFRDAKWIIALSFVLTFVLAVPDQIEELYRVVYTNGITAPHIFSSVIQFAALHIPIVLIAFVVWFGANQIVSATMASIANPKRGSLLCAWVLPMLIGYLPLLGCAVGLYNAVPVPSPADLEAAEILASPWHRFNQRGQFDFITLALHLSVGIQVLGLLPAALLAPKFHAYLQSTAHRLNETHFGHWPGVAFALAVTSAITALFVAEPVMVPQMIGAFVILLLFTICVVGFVVNFSMISMRYKVPTISVLLLLAALFSIADWTDNHTVRTVENSNPQLYEDAQRYAVVEFEKWLASRRNRSEYKDGFPVYIVAAQGGGSYAAYQTAIFLARLQDSCPQFRHHLFAISSVSGGSIGAATFAAALKALDRQILDIAPDAAAANHETLSARDDACPRITDHLDGAEVLDDPDKPGPLEAAVRKALQNDFLTPLLAAALFPDFTQRFLPIAVGPFDRARALEYTLEAGGRSFLKTQGRPLTPDDNAFESSVLDLWNANESIPALLMNTTDVESGRRFLIAPFRMATSRSRTELGDVVDYQYWNGLAPEGRQSRDLRLSTASFISARFPWITPAATIEHAQNSKVTKLKLVDGGYVDNSGVETALDLKTLLERVPADANVKLNLIVLSGGDYPVRKHFALGETLEPIRALLNTRASRAYVAIERAERVFRDEWHPVSLPHVAPLVGDAATEGDGQRAIIINRPTLKKAKLENRFYEMPLGWTLSERTREIIEHQSGRFWDCTFDERFFQVRKGLSQADCIHRLVYHELNRSWKSAALEIAIGSFLSDDRGRPRDEEQDKKINSIIRCYSTESRPDAQGFQALKVDQVRSMYSLLRAWHHVRPENYALLAYMMATASEETNGFKARRETLYYTSAAAIAKAWPARFDGMVHEEIERLYVKNPKALAERVYGDRDGHVPGSGDGWLFRGRGLAFVTTKRNYEKFGKAVGVPQIVDRPDLIFIPDLNARIFVESRFPEDVMRDLHHNFALTPPRFHEMRRLVVKVSSQPDSQFDPFVGKIQQKMKIFAKCIPGPESH